MSFEKLSAEEARERLTHVARLAAVGKVSSVAAHEINQPLNIIRMAAFNLKRAIEQGTLDPDSALQKLQRIDEQIDRAARLVGGMKAFSPTASSLKAEVKPSESIEVALELLAKRFSVANVELHHVVGEVSCEIQANPADMQELVMNLIDNALDAFPDEEGSPLDALVDGGELPEPRTITVTEGIDGGEFVCTIEDTAGGIPESVLDLVFEPFFTTWDDSTRAGLGLTTSRDIVGGLGGTVELENAGVGARATIRLPVTVAPSA